MLSKAVSYMRNELALNTIGSEQVNVEVMMVCDFLVRW